MSRQPVHKVQYAIEKVRERAHEFGFVCNVKPNRGDESYLTSVVISVSCDDPPFTVFMHIWHHPESGTRFDICKAGRGGPVNPAVKSLDRAVELLFELAEDIMDDLLQLHPRHPELADNVS